MAGFGVEDVPQHREDEGQGLAGAGLRAADAVPARHDERDALCLDRVDRRTGCESRH